MVLSFIRFQYSINIPSTFLTIGPFWKQFWQNLWSSLAKKKNFLKTYLWGQKCNLKAIMRRHHKNLMGSPCRPVFTFISIWKIYYCVNSVLSITVQKLTPSTPLIISIFFCIYDKLKPNIIYTNTTSYFSTPIWWKIFQFVAKNIFLKNFSWRVLLWFAIQHTLKTFKKRQLFSRIVLQKNA